MPTLEKITIEIIRHPSTADLPVADQGLVHRATEAAMNAYARYSRFHVGAALVLADGTVVIGSNQENAAFPAGICAERTALHAAMAQWPLGIVRTMAITVTGGADRDPVPPCGICRQALVDQEQRQGAPVRLLMAVPHGVVLEVARAGHLLPLSFGSAFLPA